MTYHVLTKIQGKKSGTCIDFGYGKIKNHLCYRKTIKLILYHSFYIEKMVLAFAHVIYIYIYIWGVL